MAVFRGRSDYVQSFNTIEGREGCRDFYEGFFAYRAAQYPPSKATRLRKILRLRDEASRYPDRHTAEIQICIASTNRFSALGRAEIEAVT